MEARSPLPPILSDPEQLGGRERWRGRKEKKKGEEERRGRKERNQGRKDVRKDVRKKGRKDVRKEQRSPVIVTRTNAINPEPHFLSTRTEVVTV